MSLRQNRVLNVAQRVLFGANGADCNMIHYPVDVSYVTPRQIAIKYARTASERLTSRLFTFSANIKKTTKSSLLH